MGRFRITEEILAKRLARMIAKDPTKDAFGNSVMRGNSLNLTPVSVRWKLFKSCGWLPRILSSLPFRGWQGWKAAQAECDRVTVSNLP